MTGSPEPPPPYRIQAAFPGVRFNKPTSIAEIPAAGRLLVTEIGGRILSFAKDPRVREADLVADLGPLADGNVSVFHATFHPDFINNRFLFVCYVHPGGGGHTRVSRFTLSADDIPKLVAGSERTVITWPAGGHNGECLQFGTDGFLYISTGDGSGPNPPDGLTAGQDVTNLLGTMLRIDVDRADRNANYAVPPDNPFVGTKGARPEIWAYGLRNPWKFGFDRETGDNFAADNGWETWESIHRIERAGNCGWPIMEGRAILRSEVKRGPTAIIPPLKDHPHSEANSVVGGPVYRGNKLPDLNGTFIYGDYITGTIWGLKTEGALALAARLHAGTLQGTDAESATAIGYQAPSSDIRGLFEHFVPESARRPTLGPNVDPQIVLKRNGDAGRGRLIYFSDSARCRNCHHAGDREQSIGRTLAEIVVKYPRDPELLQHILQPSLKIDPQFVTHVVLTDDGRVVTGLKVRESASEIVLRTAEGKEVRIPADSIDQLRQSPQSLMPEGTLSDLTAQEAADLLAYIRSSSP